MGAGPHCVGRDGWGRQTSMLEQSGYGPFYITTSIYYVNDVPHIGHAYTTTRPPMWRRGIAPLLRGVKLGHARPVSRPPVTSSLGYVLPPTPVYPRSLSWGIVAPICVSATVGRPFAGHMAHDVFISHSSRTRPWRTRCARTWRKRISVAGWRRDIRPVRCGRRPQPRRSKIAGSLSSSSLAIPTAPRMSSGRSRWRQAGYPIVAFRIHDVDPTGRMEYYLKPMHWLDAVDPPYLPASGN